MASVEVPARATRARQLTPSAATLSARASSSDSSPTLASAPSSPPALRSLSPCGAGGGGGAGRREEGGRQAAAWPTHLFLPWALERAHPRGSMPARRLAGQKSAAVSAVCQRAHRPAKPAGQPCHPAHPRPAANRAPAVRWERVHRRAAGPLPGANPPPGDEAQRHREAHRGAPPACAWWRWRAASPC